MARKKIATLNAELLAAVSKGNPAVVAKLLAAGAAVNVRGDDENQNTALTHALDVEEVDEPCIPVIELLLRAGSDPNMANGIGDTPLSCAAEYPDPKITELLLAAGAQVDAVSQLRGTALALAAVRGHGKVMQRLIASGADVNFLDDKEDGQTVLTGVLDPNYVSTKPDAKIVKALLQAGADPNKPNKEGWLPLHYAAHFDAPKLIELLVAAGADVKATVNTDLYAVDVADGQGHQKVVKRLVAHGSPTVAESATWRMQAAWQRIGQWFQQHAPSCSENLRAATGATPRALAKLERTLGVKLPADFRAYLALYGGSGRMDFYEYDGIPVEAIISRWTGLEELRRDGVFKKATPHELSKDRQQIKWSWWHTGWVPFAEDGGGNLYCLDLDPDTSGRHGQVIKWEIHGGPVGPVARSFDIFLHYYQDDMKQGKLEYRDNCLSRK